MNKHTEINIEIGASFLSQITSTNQIRVSRNPMIPRSTQNKIIKNIDFLSHPPKITIIPENFFSVTQADFSPLLVRLFQTPEPHGSFLLIRRSTFVNSKTEVQKTVFPKRVKQNWRFFEEYFSNGAENKLVRKISSRTML